MLLETLEYEAHIIPTDQDPYDWQVVVLGPDEKTIVKFVQGTWSAATDAAELIVRRLQDARAD